MDHFDQDIYYYLPIEIWKHIIDQDIKQTFSLLLTSKQFFGLTPILSDKFCFLNYLIEKNNNKLLEYYLQINTQTNISPSIIYKNYSKNNNEYLNECIKLSCIHGHLDVLEYCISNGGNFRVNNDEPLLLAIQNGHLHIVQFLYNKKVNIKTKHNLPLITACQKGDIYIVKFLLEKKASFVCKNNEVFSNACKYGHLSVVELLVEKGADIHTGKIRPIIASVIGGHVHIFKYLIDKGAKFTKFDNIIYITAFYGSFEMMKYILDNHYNDPDSIKEALMRASSCGNLEMVKYLHNKYDYNYNQTYKAFGDAAINNHIDIVKYLYGKGIVFVKHLYTNDFIFTKHLFNFDIVTKCPRALFYGVICSRHKEIIEFFLENHIFDIDEFYEEIVNSIPNNTDACDYLIEKNKRISMSQIYD
ncbi:repeat protein [Moumouvirus goulette]|uniref:Repeat protein n=1 Tax=Moumouvirus goulette TaxID=1247379 RepID=M1NLI3_9VIRU|nr:repeat protein [Moumouvirus goulette]AGF84865.1 repeat protein [Moumouvirus goulette]